MPVLTKIAGLSVARAHEIRRWMRRTNSRLSNTILPSLAGKLSKIKSFVAIFDPRRYLASRRVIELRLRQALSHNGLRKEASDLQETDALSERGEGM